MTAEKYTPSKTDYIRVQGNKQYLPVPNRVQWFRGEHPSWTIHTSVVQLDFAAGYAVMRAEVLDDSGRLIASGMKTETRKGFSDFVEKAETGAVGRALARAGFGTEDALDLEGERYADTPIQQPERDRGGNRPSNPNAPAPASRSPEEQALLDEILAVPGMTYARMSLLADAVGVEKGSRASAEQLRAILARATTPDGSARPSGSGVEASEGASTPTDTPVEQAVGPAAPATTQGEGAASPPGGSSPASAPFTDPAALETYAAAVLGFEQPQPLKDLTPADFEQVWGSLGLADLAAYQEWYPRQERAVRQALMAAKQSPRHRADAVRVEPQQESLAEALGAPVSDR